MSDEETTEEIEIIEIEMIEEDGGQIENAQFRCVLAVAVTMLAELAEEMPHKVVQADALNQIAGNIAAGNDGGLQFINAHVNKMKAIKVVAMSEPEGDEDE